MTAFSHAPVMVAQIIKLAEAVQPARIVDCTVGGAGHAAALLQHFPNATLLGIDRDPTAVAVATARLQAFGPRAQVVHAPFGEIAGCAAKFMPEGANMVLGDFGVSSHQLDVPERGFSFRFDGPLDMRMDPTTGDSVAQLLRCIELDPLTAILRELGEERYARRIARAIVASPPQTTAELSDLVRACVPKKGPERIDPATRTFQALRMAVNDELGQIAKLLHSLPEVLADDGLFVALSFHSLEDRAVKHAIRAMSVTCTCPRLLPECLCKAEPTLRLHPGKAQKPTDDEIAHNPRARSTRLRAAYRVRRPHG